MPPRRNKPSSTTRAPVQVAPSPSPSPLFETEPLQPPPAFFNVSFSTHRVSPLYIGDNPLSHRRLDELSRRLRDTLVGDVVRGVQVGLEGSDTSLGRAGSLEHVTTRWFNIDALFGSEQDDEQGRRRPPSRDLSSDAPAGDTAGGRSGQEGLCFEMRYENTLCTAILLPTLDDGGRDQSTNGFFRGPFKPQGALGMPAGSDTDLQRFLHLPLLLMRMPAPLKSFITDFIARTFDCRVSPLRLGTKSLVGAWEQWIRAAGLPTRGPLAKELVLTLGFYVPPEEPKEKDLESRGVKAAPAGMGLRSIEVFVSTDDLGLFLRAGEDSESAGLGSVRKRGLSQGWEDDSRKRSKLAGGSNEEGWAWRAANGGTRGADIEAPFIDALAQYLDRHLALDLFHPGVQVTKIACGGFALADNRLKLIGFKSNDGDVAGPATAVRGLVSNLVNRASG